MKARFRVKPSSSRPTLSASPAMRPLHGLRSRQGTSSDFLCLIININGFLQDYRSNLPRINSRILVLLHCLDIDHAYSRQ